jgi:putative spermidine/putrescine transport system permease protein
MTKPQPKPRSVAAIALGTTRAVYENQKFKIVLLLAPALLILGGLFLGGLSIGALRSLNYSPNLGQTVPNLTAYVTLLGAPDTYWSFLLSAYIALASTLISAVLAVASALLLRQTFAGRATINFLFQLNLTVPHLVGAIGILYLFSQSGSFARLAFAAGAIDAPRDFPALIFDPNAAGIILLYVWKEVPFIGLILLANLQSVGDGYEHAARTLGATRWQTFRYVVLPLITPSLAGASALVFAFTFGAYEIPALLGAHYPTAVPVEAYKKFTDVDLNSRPEAMALSVLIAMVSAVLVVIYLRATARR